MGIAGRFSLRIPMEALMFFFPFQSFLPWVGIIAPVPILCGNFVRQIRDNKKAEDLQRHEYQHPQFCPQREYVTNPDFWNRFVLHSAYENLDTIRRIKDVIFQTDSHSQVWIRIPVPTFPSAEQKKALEERYGIRSLYSAIPVIACRFRESTYQAEALHAFEFAMQVNSVLADSACGYFRSKCVGLS